MRVVENDGDMATIELSRHEVTILTNAINEICNGPEAIEDPEFGTRMGASRQEAQALLAAFHDVP